MKHSPLDTLGKTDQEIATHNQNIELAALLVKERGDFNRQARLENQRENAYHAFRLLFNYVSPVPKNPFCLKGNAAYMQRAGKLAEKVLLYLFAISDTDALSINTLTTRADIETHYGKLLDFYQPLIEYIKTKPTGLGIKEKTAILECFEAFQKQVVNELGVQKPASKKGRG